MITDIRFYWKLFLRRLPIMAVIFVISAAVGFGLSVTLPPKYEANARLLVEGAQIPDELAASTVQTERAERLEIIKQQLLTRENLLDIANEFKVYDRTDRLTPDEIVSGMRSLVSISTTGGRNRATLMNISFTAEDAWQAAGVANRFVTLVLQQDAERRQGIAEQTLDFFEQEVARSDDELKFRSAAIVDFKERNQDALPENLNFRIDRQSRLQDQILAATRDRSALNEQRNRLMALGSFNNTAAVTLPPEQQALQQAQRELQQALTVYSETNPKIRLLKAQVERLQIAVDAVSGGAEDNAAAANNGLDPAKKLFDLQLDEIDQRMKLLDRQISRAQEEIDVLRDAIERTPENAIQLESLERDYKIAQQQYNEAVESLAKAQTGERIELLSRGERIRVIEEATPPDAPNSPNRQLIAGGGVALGSALAVGLFILLELLNRTIRRPSDLTRSLSVQPIATIPYLETAGGRMRRRALQTILIGSLAIGIPAVLWAIHTYYLPLDLLMAKIMNRFNL